MDFVQRMSAWAQNNLELQSLAAGNSIRFDLIKDDNDIAFLDAPSSENYQEMSRQSSLNYQVQLLVQNLSQKKAHDDSWLLYQSLKVLTGSQIKSSDNSFVLVSCSGYVPPQLVDTTEHGAFLYSAMIKADVQMIQ